MKQNRPFSGLTPSMNLAPSSPLYQAGSRTPDAAGLYHYTTQLDQTKEASGHSLNIGVHYVAAGQTGKPADSELPTPDGIADYVENASGDGVHTHPIETDWGVTQTLAGTPDASNAIYDYRDLDGDGLSGRAEKAFGKNPLLADNPMTLPSPSVGSQPNTITFVVPVSFDVVVSLGRLRLLVDGHATSFQRCDRETSGACVITWDTTYAAPGSHSVQAELCLNADPPLVAGAGPLTGVVLTVAEQPYQYPLVPGTQSWRAADPMDRVYTAQLPEEWRSTATSWQLFSSAVANPYFRVTWLPGNSMTESYAAVKRTMSLSVLEELESRPDFGANVLRYLVSCDVATAAAADNVFVTRPCIFDYYILCHMAGLDATLNNLTQPSLERLFKLAVWDANFLISTGDTLSAAAPTRLIYAVYGKLAQPPSGVNLAPLSSDQNSELDSGNLPPELTSIISSVRASLGMTARP